MFSLFSALAVCAVLSAVFLAVVIPLFAGLFDRYDVF